MHCTCICPLAKPVATIVPSLLNSQHIISEDAALKIKKETNINALQGTTPTKGYENSKGARYIILPFFL